MTDIKKLNILKMLKTILMYSLLCQIMLAIVEMWILEIRECVLIGLLIYNKPFDFLMMFINV